MTFVRAFVLAVLVLGMGVASAQASPIMLNCDFSASGFAPASAPVEPVTGSFSITFDNTGYQPPVVRAATPRHEKSVRA